MILGLFFATLSCTAIDGDTLICGHEYIRLIGIDAPEMKGHCRKGRVCVSGDPLSSKQSLLHGLKLGPIKIKRFGKDRYGRTLAIVSAGNKDLSCYQLNQHAAIYVKKWDRGGIVSSLCKNQSS